MAVAKKAAKKPAAKKASAKKVAAKRLKPLPAGYVLRPGTKLSRPIELGS